MSDHPKILVIAHVFYHDLTGEILHFLENIPYQFDVILTTPFDEDELASRVHASFPQAKVLKVNNVGRDIWPFIAALRSVSLSDYDLICKIHTKKSPHAPQGDIWRKALFSSLLGSPERVRDVTNLFSTDENVGMIGCETYLSRKHSEARNHFDFLSEKLNAKRDDLIFVAGTMFWVRASLLSDIRDAEWIQEKLFKPFGPDIKDGHIEHAFERVMGNMVRSRGYSLVGLSPFVRPVIHEGQTNTRLPLRSLAEYMAQDSAGDETSSAALPYEWDGESISGPNFEYFFDFSHPHGIPFCLCLNCDSSVFRKPIRHYNRLRSYFDHPMYITIDERPLVAMKSKRFSFKRFFLLVCWRIHFRRSGVVAPHLKMMGDTNEVFGEDELKVGPGAHAKIM